MRNVIQMAGKGILVLGVVLVVLVTLGMGGVTSILHLIGDGAGNLVDFVQAKMK